MNDRSVAGKMYLGDCPGRDIRTGLSRRSGGRCCGRRVYCRLGTEPNETGCVIPGRNTTTGTFPIRTVVEKDRLGGVVLGAVGTTGRENPPADKAEPEWTMADGLGAGGGGGSSPATVL